MARPNDMTVEVRCPSSAGNASLRTAIQLQPPLPPRPGAHLVLHPGRPLLEAIVVEVGPSIAHTEVDGAARAPRVAGAAMHAARALVAAGWQVHGWVDMRACEQLKRERHRTYRRAAIAAGTGAEGCSITQQTLVPLKVPQPRGASPPAPVVVPRNGHVHAVPVQQALKRLLQLRTWNCEQTEARSARGRLPSSARPPTYCTAFAACPKRQPHPHPHCSHLDGSGLLALVAILVSINVHGPV